MRTPVLLLLFNRPQHAAAVLDRIRAAQPPRLYVHIDGPRANKPGEAERTAACAALLSNINWPCTVHTLIRIENKGLRAGVYEALNWFFEQEPWGIVLEDDCLPDPSFFTFCETLLEHYAEDPRVMHIGGSNLAARHLNGQSDSFVWSHFSLVWGWAGWRRAWTKMSISLDGLQEFRAKAGIRYLTRNPMAQTYMLDKFEQTRLGTNNSWAYAWFYSILKHKGLCIIPTVNLIQNTGVGDADATHTSKSDPRARLQADTMQFPLRLPPAQVPDPPFEAQVFYHTQKPKLRLWLWYVLKMLRLR